MAKTTLRVSIDFDDRAVRYVAVNGTDAGAVTAFGERRLPPGVIKNGKVANRRKLTDILKKCAKTWRIKRQAVRFHVPDAFVFLRSVDIPEHVQEEEIKSHLYMEMAASLPLPFEDPIFDYIPLENHKILLVASSRAIVADYAEALRKAGLKPIAADITPLSFYRLLHARGIAEPDDHVLCVGLHRHMMNVSIFHDDKPLFIRQFLGTYDIALGTEAAYNADEKDALTEIERVLHFYRYTIQRGEAGITKIVLLSDSDHVDLRDADPILSAALGVPVKTLQSSDFPTETAGPIPETCLLALGLALREDD